MNNACTVYHNCNHSANVFIIVAYLYHSAKNMHSSSVPTPEADPGINFEGRVGCTSVYEFNYKGRGAQ